MSKYPLWHRINQPISYLVFPAITFNILYFSSCTWYFLTYLSTKSFNTFFDMLFSLQSALKRQSQETLSLQLFVSYNFSLGTNLSPRVGRDRSQGTTLSLFIIILILIQLFCSNSCSTCALIQCSSVKSFRTKKFPVLPNVDGIFEMWFTSHPRPIKRDLNEIKSARSADLLWGRPL